MNAMIMLTIKITDQEQMAAYRAVAGDALKKHGAEVIGAGPVKATLSGPEQDLSTGVVIKFSTEQAAHDWINDPELTDVHAMRNAAGDVRIILVSLAG